jgi:hypothetical protein
MLLVEVLPELLKEIMQEAKTLTDAERWVSFCLKSFVYKLLIDVFLDLLPCFLLCLNISIVDAC